MHALPQAAAAGLALAVALVIAPPSFAELQAPSLEGVVTGKPSKEGNLKFRALEDDTPKETPAGTITEQELNKVDQAIKSKTGEQPVLSSSLWLIHDTCTIAHQSAVKSLELHTPCHAVPLH